jgi:tetratricopeptide (TPR) repeat protein
LLAKAMPASLTALSRLAQAEMAIGENEIAKETAHRVLNLTLENRLGPVDVPAVFAAAHVLILLGQSETVEHNLRGLSEHPVLAVMAASVAADSGHFNEALDLLANLTSADAENLRGYIHFRLDNPRKAVTHLRCAYNIDNTDPDVCVNLARAFWKLGSARKATVFARQAARLAPGRKDISVLVIDFLVSSGQIDSAENEVRKLLERGIVEYAELVLRRASIVAARGDIDRAIVFLRRSESLAKNEDGVFKLEVDAVIARMQYLNGQIRSDQALRTIRSAMERVPGSVPLLATFAEICDHKSQAPELKIHFDRVERLNPGMHLRSVETDLAYLSGDFDRLATMITEWTKEDPLNSHLAAMALIMQFHLTQNRRDSAKMAKQAIRRFGNSSPLVSNNAAFILALSGEPGLAEKILREIRGLQKGRDFTVLATSGLVAIAQGDLQEGLRRYRRAAEAAERGHRGYIDRPRMVVNQGLALWLLGITRADIDVAVRAAVLPVVELPDDWEDLAEFQFLRWACRKAGCPWPPTVS